MTHIWGIGRKKVSSSPHGKCIHVSLTDECFSMIIFQAAELVKLGYTNISEVRQGLATQTLQLNENALIGVKYYEDFREKMTRQEVELIGDIVKKACYEKFPEAEIELMGSYRRGKKECGDIDG